MFKRRIGRYILRFAYVLKWIKILKKCKKKELEIQIYSNIFSLWWFPCGYFVLYLSVKCLAASDKFLWFFWLILWLFLLVWAKIWKPEQNINRFFLLKFSPKFEKPNKKYRNHCNRDIELLRRLRLVFRQIKVENKIWDLD